MLEIEIRSKTEPSYGWHDAVMRMFLPLDARRFNFVNCDFKIDGKIYTSRNADFNNVIEQNIIWNRLNG